MNIWHTFLLTGLFALAALLGFGATLLINQSRFIYFPEQVLAATPAELGLGFREITFTTADRVRLHGWLIPAEAARGVILFCHGNGGNISHLLETIDIFHRLGYTTFSFDYRGYGKSEGAPTETGTYLDAEAAWGYLVDREKTAPGQIVLCGRSLGGAIAARLAATVKPRACILESSFTSVPDMAAHLYPLLPAVRWFCRFTYDTESAVKVIRCPVLIVHSRDDELVPFSHGQRLFAAALEPKTFLPIHGDHNAGFRQSGRLYEAGLEEFLNRTSQPVQP